jgi:hypothetical protein
LRYDDIELLFFVLRTSMVESGMTKLNDLGQVTPDNNLIGALCAPFALAEQLLLRFKLCNHQLSADFLSNEINLVSRFYLVEYCRVLNLERHRHRRHAEIL